MADHADIDKLNRRYLRMAKKVEILENLIEEKTRDLYRANLSLEQANNDLEVRVLERTEELAQALLVAEEANKAKADFLANTSHELRTPLHGMLGVAEFLLGGTKDPEYKEALDLILRSGRQLVELINSVLDFEKLDANKFELEVRPFSPKDVVEHIVWLFGERAKEKKITLEAKFSHLPEQVLGDELRLTQVLSNLVSNAVKFTENGRVTLEVESQEPALGDSLRQPGSPTSELPKIDLVWRIKDTGSGIAEERREMLFEPFEQAESSTARVHGGTGLGLAICKGFVELMGGTISLESTVAKGSIFHFTTRHLLTDEAVPSIVEQAPISCARKILVVDDNAINRKVAQMMLSRLGCDVRLASGASEALELATHQHFDLIFMDCHMPVTDGYESTQQLQQALLSACPPVVGLSATSEKTKDRCLAAGMSDFLQKPANLPALYGMIKRWTSS